VQEADGKILPARINFHAGLPITAGDGYIDR
jgi:hypothetical protein